jgi:hypothetical protein
VLQHDFANLNNLGCCATLFGGRGVNTPSSPINQLTMEIIQKPQYKARYNKKVFPSLCPEYAPMGDNQDSEWKNSLTMQFGYNIPLVYIIVNHFYQRICN